MHAICSSKLNFGASSQPVKKKDSFCRGHHGLSTVCGLVSSLIVLGFNTCAYSNALRRFL